MNKSEQISVQSFRTAFGELILGEFGGRLCLCDWRYRKMRGTIDRRLTRGLGARFVEGDGQIIETARQQLEEFFARKRREFTVPLLPVGTDFQKCVWTELMTVPCGKTASYGEIAQRIGHGKAVRAVANANGANALSIFIPCHRIIGGNGKLTGYAGGLNTKKKLLFLERGLLF